MEIRGRVEEADIRNMAASIAHRGPDGVGWWTGDNVALASARLAVIDLPGGKQPMISEDGRWVLVYNGEIYNHLELRKELENKGHTFRTRSDTEVVLHSVIEWGAQAIGRFRGVFAFAVWDCIEKTFLVARDRLGVKPLYVFFAKGGGLFAFASEIKALLQLDEVRKNVRPDLGAIHQVMSFNFPLGDRTVFEGIREIPPGRILTWDNGRTGYRRYWDLKMPLAGDRAEVGDEDKIAGEFLDRLRESVRLRLMSDVPLGVFLSGGPDSSLIAALVGKELNNGPQTFSIGFDEPLWDESEWAQKAAAYIGAEHTLIKSKVGLEMLPEVIYYLDQPQRWAGTTSLLQLYQAAKERATVVLTGEGADEILAGYSHLAEFPGMIRQAPEGVRPEVLYLRLLRELEYDQAERLYSPEFFDAAGKPVVGFLPDDDKIKQRDPLDVGIYLDAKLRLARFVVFMQDRLSMAAGVEARVPFLDHEFVEYAAGIHPDLKLRPPWGKYILRLAAKDLLPKEIVERPKQGFVEPADAWMRGEAPDCILQALSPDVVASKGFFQSGEVVRLLEMHRSGSENHGNLLIGIASVHIWHDIFFGSRRPEPPSV